MVCNCMQPIDYQYSYYEMDDLLARIRMIYTINSHTKTAIIQIWTVIIDLTKPELPTSFRYKLNLQFASRCHFIILAQKAVE